MTDTTVDRPIYRIAAEIEREWRPPNFAAKPYLDAMHSLHNINDPYYADSGKTVVAYFLSNASSWRGEVARRIKVELKSLLKRAA